MDTDQPQNGKGSELRVYVWTISMAVAFVALLWAMHLSWGVINVFAILALIVALLGKYLIGKAQYVQISSPAFERRIQDRFRSESNQLLSLGFTPLFFYGEGFSLFRFLLIYPAFVFFIMWLNREVASVHNGSRLIFGFPVFGSANGTSYAHPNQLGMKFHTLFQDGTILLTKNFGGQTKYGARVVLCRLPGGTIDRTWAEHQQKIQTLEAIGKQIDRTISFETFAKISDEA